MFIALNVAEEFVLSGTKLQLTEKKKEYEMNQHMSYILNQVEQYIAENKCKFKLEESEIFVRVTRLKPWLHYRIESPFRASPLHSVALLSFQRNGGCKRRATATV